MGKVMTGYKTICCKAPVLYKRSREGRVLGYYCSQCGGRVTVYGNKQKIKRSVEEERLFWARLNKRVRMTGYIGDNEEDKGDASNYIHRLLVMMPEEWERFRGVEGYQNVLARMGVTLVSIRRKGELSFLHCTAPRNLKSIEETGLRVQRSCLDMGDGVYVIRNDQTRSAQEGRDNLIDFLVENEIDEVGMVKGYYEGVYEECVWGEGHKGYVLLKKGVESCAITETNTKSIEELY